MKLAVANHKGGVGKTTTVVNLAAGLAALGRATLLVDADPQGNSTMSFLDSTPYGTSLLEVLTEPDTAAARGIRPTSVPNLSIIPARGSLATAEKLLSSDADGLYRLKDKLGALGQEFEFIVVDTPPNLGILTVNALAAASHVLIPVQASYFSLEGTEELLETVRRVKAGFNCDLAILGVLITMKDRRTVIGKDISRKVREMFGDLTFETEISRSVRLEESPAYKVPVFTYAPKSRSAGEYLSLCAEVAERAERTAARRRTSPKRPHLGASDQARRKRAGQRPQTDGSLRS